VKIRTDFEEKNLRISRQLDVAQSKLDVIEAQKVEAEREAYFARFKAEYVLSFSCFDSPTLDSST
jgi:hypothetical protein